VVLTAKEEWYSMVPGHGNGMEAVGVVAAAWNQWRRIGHGKFWQPDDVKVKIL
jgi:hypothetical protein